MSLSKHGLFDSLVFVVAMLSSAVAPCATITGNRGTIYITLTLKGEIKPGDDDRVREYLANATPQSHVHVLVESRGGDVHTAMRIGRLLRQHEAYVDTDLCMSSCVFILVGGVERSVITYSTSSTFWKQGFQGVGLHRPYFSMLSPDMSSAEITERRHRLLTEVATYMKEMNASPRVLEQMEAIPPEKMKMLTASEVSDLGLDAPDPVWDEKDVAASAAQYGLISSEFRRRRVSAVSRCAAFRVSISQSNDKNQEHYDCVEGVLWGLGMQEYYSRDRRFLSWAHATFRTGVREGSESVKPFAQSCRISFMRDAAEKCER